MSDEERINPGHKQARSALRLVGPMVLGVGVLLMIIGLGSFFSSFGSFEPPRYFWCCFLGMPMIVVGLALTKFGFMGAILRYQAGEVAPVGKDTFNYMADGTKGGVQTVASAIGKGLSEGLSGDSISVLCPRCKHANDTNAKYCDECGTAISKACPSCGESNDGGAKFCDACGSRFTNE